MTAHLKLPAMPVGPQERALTCLACGGSGSCGTCWECHGTGIAHCIYCGVVPDEAGCRCAEIDARIDDALERGE